MFPLVAILTLALCSRCTQSKEPAQPSPVVSPGPEITDVTAAGQDTLAAENDTAWVFVDEAAQFQGGSLETFRDWVQQNLVYPPEAVEKGIFGKVIVQFTVNSQGRVGEVKILRGVDPKLDKEVNRVLLLSPDWIPAEDGDRKVKQKFVMPVIFQLK